MCTVRVSFVFVLSFICTQSIFSMDIPQEEKTWTWEMFHIIDQWSDPLSYFTDTKAPKVCEDVMRFGLDAQDAKHRAFTGDVLCLEDVKSAFRRQRALLTSLEAECQKDVGSKVELLRDAYERQKEYFSLNVLSLIESYLEKATKNARHTAHVLDRQTKKILEPVPLAEHLTSVDIIDENRAVTYQTIETLVMGTPWLSWENTVNFVRKTVSDPLKYLIDEKAQNISLAMRHFHPRHKFHNEQWMFNNKLEFHKRLIHQALEREKRLLNAIEYAVVNNKPWMLVSLNPTNPDNKMVMDNIRSSYSPLACATIRGFLNAHADKKQREALDREQKERDQKELHDKNVASIELIGSLRRILRDFKDKAQLNELNAWEKDTPGRLEVQLYNKGIKLEDIRRIHNELTNFSMRVNALLATPVVPLQSSAPASVPQSPQSVPAPAQVPVQMLVDTSHLAQAASSAASTAIQQTILPASPAPLSLAPGAADNNLRNFVPQNQKQMAAVGPNDSANMHAVSPKSSTSSPSTSIAPASVTPPTASPTHGSPQASPPRTPNGSLVVSQTEDEFNPRAPQPQPTITPTPAAAKQPAEPKGKNRGKKLEKTY